MERGKDGKTHPEFPLGCIAHSSCARRRIAAAPESERSDFREQPRTSALYFCRSFSHHPRTTTEKLLSGVLTPNPNLFCGRIPFPACNPQQRSVLCKKFIKKFILLLFSFLFLLFFFPFLSDIAKNTRMGVGFFNYYFHFHVSSSGQRAFRSVLHQDFKAFSAPDLREEEERSIRAHSPPNSRILEPHQPSFTEPNATSALFVGFSSSECILTAGPGEGECGVTVPHCSRMGNGLCGVGAAPWAAEPHKVLVVPFIWRCPRCSSVCCSEIPASAPDLHPTKGNFCTEGRKSANPPFLCCKTTEM